MNDKIIVRENNCKLTDANQMELVKLNNIDFFPLSTITEQKYIVSSYSANLYKSIHGNDVMKSNEVTKILSRETVKIIRKQHIYNTVRNNFTIEEIKDIVKEITEDVIPDNRWITLEQYVNIIKKGLSRDLTDYNLFCITNLKGWIESYRIKYMSVIRKQRSYEKTKEMHSHTNMTNVEKRQLKISEFYQQLISLKIILSNPNLINEVDESEQSELKKAFTKTLRIKRHTQGYNLDIVFDYLLKSGRISVDIDDLVKNRSIEGIGVIKSAELTMPQEVKKKFIIVSAKTDYIIRFAKSIIDNNEVDEFLDKFVYNYIVKK